MWKGIHLQSALEGMLGVRVFVGNDANLGALAERWWGSCKDVDDFVFVKIYLLVWVQACSKMETSCLAISDTQENSVMFPFPKRDCVDAG